MTTHDPENFRSQTPHYQFNLKNWTDNRILFVLIFVAVISTAFSAFQNVDGFSAQWMSDFAQNFSTEMFGAFLTFILLEMVVHQRRELEATEVSTEIRKQELIRQMASPNNGMAIQAVNELRANGWLSDGSLQGINLYRADLTGANLTGADLSRSRLSGVILKDAFLRNANLEGAWFTNSSLENCIASRANLANARLNNANMRNIDLTESNFQNAHLDEVDLNGAQLIEANFQNTRFSEVNLSDATLYIADLRYTQLFDVRLSKTQFTGANFADANVQSDFEEDTRLPDDSLWSPATDFSQFVSSTWHPDETLELIFGAEDKPDDIEQLDSYLKIPIYSHWQRQGWLKTTD